MIYTLPLQSDEILQSAYFELRQLINPESDIIHLTVRNSLCGDLSTGDIYKKILKLDGKFRTTTNNWKAPRIKMRVINQL